MIASSPPLLLLQRLLLNTSFRVQNPLPWYLVRIFGTEHYFFLNKNSSMCAEYISIIFIIEVLDFPTEFFMPRMFRVSALGLNDSEVVI